MVVHTYNPSTWEGEAEWSQVHGHPGLHNDDHASLGYVGRLCHKQSKNKINPDIILEQYNWVQEKPVFKKSELQSPYTLVKYCNKYFILLLLLSFWFS
jgi:hypothetical protein